MYLKKTRQKSGRTYLSIVDGYFDKEKGHSRTVTIEKVGYLDEMEKLYDDPIQHFENRVEELKAEKKDKSKPVSLSFDLEERLTLGQCSRKNLGYAALNSVYHQLGLHSFLSNKQRQSRVDYNMNDVLKLLVFSRLLYPGSKKQTYENRGKFFEKHDYSLDDVYRFLKPLNDFKNDIQVRMNKQIKSKLGRNTELVYYDVTNYYFESDVTDEFRKKGISKEKRPNPIVQLGLFMDQKGIPITFDLFPGNTNDCLTLRPGLSKIQKEYGLGKVVVVADKGLTTGDNIHYTLSGKHGYVFSMSVRGATKELKNYVLDEEGYTWYGSEYKRKSRLYPRTIQVTSRNGKKIKKVVDEKQVIFYSEKYAKKAKADRAKILEKALDIVNNPSKFSKATSFGAAGYIKNLNFDKESGEILSATQSLQIDTEKLKAEEALDGYYVIITSEYKETDDQIIDIYRGLWRIEESFRVTKSDLEARPVYVSKKEHIHAHFLTCFIALVIVRIIEVNLNYKYSVSKILNSLSKAECSHMNQNFYVFNYYDDVLKDIGDIYNIDYSKKNRSIGEMKKILAATKKG